MSRENILTIRMTEVERDAADRLAVLEKLPLSTMIRRNLLKQAESKGIWPPLSSQALMADARLDAE